MRNFLKAATLWQAAISCLAGVDARRQRDASHDILNIAGSIGHDSSLTVIIPIECPGCFKDVDRPLTFELIVPASSEACGTDAVILDRLALDLSAHQERVTNYGDVAIPTRDADDLFTYTANVQSTCASDRGAVLSVELINIGHDQLEAPVGFTVAYTQGPTPSILRLNDQFVNVSNDQHFLSSWLHPKSSQRLTIMPNASEGTSRQTLDQEISKLEDLKIELHDLFKAIAAQEHKIVGLIKPDFKTCRGLKCMIQKTIQKLPDVGHLIASHFRSHFKPRPSQISLEKHFNCSRQDDFELDQPDLTMHDELEDGPGISSVTQALPPTLPTLPDLPVMPETPKTPEAPSSDLYIAANSSSSNLSPALPTNLSHHYHLHRLVRGAILLTLVVFATLFVHRLALKAREASWFPLCAHHRQARAARREMRAQRRAHRRADRRHRWSQWWSRYRNPKSVADYEEKRAMILQQEGVLEDAMQHDIDTLRVAQDLASSMVEAEEGRARLYRHANTPVSSVANHNSEYRPYRQPHIATPFYNHAPTPLPPFPSLTNLFHPRHSSRRHSAASSSGSTQYSQPPLYEQELAGEMTVVDGFSYVHDFTPSATDSTPDSSVVDCSPRLSFETGTTSVSARYDLDGGDGEDDDNVDAFDRY